MPADTKYVIVTPVRDEEEHIEGTIQAVAEQTVRPRQWVIVDDGSTDSTGQILDRYAKQFAWIRVLHRTNRGFRKSGAGVVEAFYEGYGAMQAGDWDFLVKLDGDLSFEREYFEKCFEHFRSDPKLGIGGGEIYYDHAGSLKLEANPRFHVRGATKIYRKACWEAIGGLREVPGWDTIDEIKANMQGWTSYSFRDLQLMHHRPTGQADGLWSNRVKHGLACYASGYHPLFVAASCVLRLRQKPYVLGSAGILWGYVKGRFTNLREKRDKQLTSYVHHQQLRRLCGMDTIWK